MTMMVMMIKLVLLTGILYLDGLNLLLLLSGSIWLLRWLIDHGLSTLHLYQLTTY